MGEFMGFLFCQNMVYYIKLCAGDDILNTCVIFCAGGFDCLAEPIDGTDLVIAADGGLSHVQALKLKPDVVLGDFDSLGYVPDRARVFPVEKDDTDAMLAVRHGLKAGFRRFVIYGGMDGPRLDHTVANFQTLQYLADRGAVGYLAGARTMATVLKNGTAVFSGAPRGLLSLFCMGSDARGVTLTGLKYPLTGETLTAGHPLGVSNHFLEREAAVQVRSGSLLLLYDRENGFPTERSEDL